MTDLATTIINTRLDDVSASEKLILAVIASFGGVDCQLAMPELSSLAGITRQSVNHNIKRLEDKGYLTVVRNVSNADNASVREPNIYTINVKKFGFNLVPVSDIKPDFADE